MNRESCLSDALRLLSIRDLTEHQLRMKLEARGHPSTEIQDVIERLQSDHTLNDERLAHARARREAERGRKGPHRVRRELEEAGVTASLARAAVTAAFGEADAGQTLNGLLQKRLRGLTALNQTEYRRVYQYLLRRGFDGADIVSALRRYQRLK
ncbi:MAG: regulatory protein RecX [Acidobacteria bacterium]|nr:regulatory protein RecX [Acidobacteriota bacterium]